MGSCASQPVCVADDSPKDRQLAFPRGIVLLKTNGEGAVVSRANGEGVPQGAEVVCSALITQIGTSEEDGPPPHRTMAPVRTARDLVREIALSAEEETWVHPRYNQSAVLRGVRLLHAPPALCFVTADIVWLARARATVAPSVGGEERES